jgi:CubicO group peptidase (beta-lactamase class C family)
MNKTMSRSILAAAIAIALSGTAWAQATGDDALSAQVDEVVRAQMREQGIPGVSLAVMRNGKIIKASGYGLANLELSVPVAPEMVFHSGSLAKAFTATAVMMLVEQGKVGLDDRIAKYVKEAPAAWDEVTIRRLLSHTSGLRDYFGEEGDLKADLRRDFTEEELVRIFAAQTMRFAPGEKWSYCNAGYVVLGVLIHRVTGRFWFDFVKQRILDPLGMTSTRLINTDDIIPNRVSGYTLVKGQLKNDPWMAPSWGTTADGSLYMSVVDMAKWDAALYTEKLVKRSTLEQMWTPVRLNAGTTYPYGFAWRVREVQGHRLIQHDGVDVSFTTRFARYVNDGLSIIVLLNVGEDEEAAMPTRMTDSVAAIYIPGLGGPGGAEVTPAGHAPAAADELVPGPEMERLKFYIGDWMYSEEYPRSDLFPNGGRNTGHWSAQRGPDGLSIVNAFASHGGGDNYQGMEVMMWDPKEQAYRDNALWYDSPDRWTFTGRFEGDTLAYKGEFDYLGKHVQFRSETRANPGGGFTLTEFARVNGRPEQLILVGRAEKRPGS